jgi:polysaccharide pyruvyl transferase CsaB
MCGRIRKERPPRGTQDALSIGFLGSYGGLNTGDEAILTAVLDAVRTLRPTARLVVFSRNPEHTAAHHHVHDVIGWEQEPRAHVAASVARLDLLVLGGGGVLYDTESHRYLQVVQAANDAGVPVFVYAVGAGPLHDPEERAVARRVLTRARDLVVRDQGSRLVLENAGIDRDIVVTADPALLLRPVSFRRHRLDREGIPDDVRLVGMSVREPGSAVEHLDVNAYHSLLALVADFLVHRLDAHVLFMPMERDDVRHSHAVLSQMTDPARGRILHGEVQPGEVLGLMDHLHLVVGMRLHFLMFAAMAGVPFLPLPYARKVSDFAMAAGVPGLRGVIREQAGPLLAEIDRLWDERPARQLMVRERVAALIERAAVTRDRLGYLLDDLDGVVPARSAPPGGTA